MLEEETPEHGRFTPREMNNRNEADGARCITCLAAIKQATRCTNVRCLGCCGRWCVHESRVR